MSTELAKAKQGQFGMIGLGVMGRNLALNVEDHHFPVSVWNLETDWVDSFVNENPGKRFTGTHTLEEFVAALERPRRIMMMIKAGAPVDMTIERLKPLLAPGDIIIDGGNSFYKDTQRREAGPFDTGQIPATSLDVQDVDFGSGDVAAGDLDRGVAAAVQDQSGLAAEQPRPVHAGVERVGGRFSPAVVHG